jgi:hypothetical protein
VDGIVYGNLRIELLAEHGGKVVRTPLQARPPALRLRPRLVAPSGPVRLLGRDAEVAAAAVNPGEAITIHAACGYGKSTLLRQLAAQAGAEEQAAVVYLRVGDQRPTICCNAWSPPSTPPTGPSSQPHSSAPSCWPRRAPRSCSTT